jgi:dolichyl-phosphate-mannose-protein mannosyltransferase
MSTVPVSTIGGEPGGRAPIVVEDKPIPSAKQEEQTSVVAGKAEPGRDIFAGDPAKNIQSQSAPVVDTPPAAEKEISTVIIQQTTATSESTVDEAREKEIAGGYLKEEASTRGVDSKLEVVEGDADTLKPAGPLAEAEAEAERAAYELYPDVV